MKKPFVAIAPLVLLLALLVGACTTRITPPPIGLDQLPPFASEPYVEVNGNMPFFTQEELDRQTDFETYSPLDGLGRCGVAYANICVDVMPTEERGSIGQVKPSGWQTVKYDFVDGKYLYNRCHLIGFQLAGENANEENLITGTRYLNVEGMLPFENRVADYVKETGNHVLYRVTPIYEGENLVASGVLMEAQSLEDGGDGVTFNVYCYNNMPGVTIDYATGLSRLDGESAPVPEGTPGAVTYVLNTGTDKFHTPDCASVTDMKPNNRELFSGTREEALARGYTPCGRCKP